MYRGLLVVFVLLLALPAVRSDDDARKDEPEQRGGDSQQHFTKHIEPLTAGIREATAFALYEGLPRKGEPEFAKELQEKETIQLHDFPFYAEAISVEPEDAKKLTILCRNTTTYARYSGPKFCGGFHPDWCVEFKDGDKVYHVLICFGCHEARLYGPKNEVFSDLKNNAYAKFVAILTPLQKNRPKLEPKRKRKAAPAAPATECSYCHGANGPVHHFA